MSEAVKRIGSRAEVFNGTARMTSGGLTKDDLVQREDGTYMSIRASNARKKKTSVQVEVNRINKRCEALEISTCPLNTRGEHPEEEPVVEEEAVPEPEHMQPAPSKKRGRKKKQT